MRIVLADHHETTRWAIRTRLQDEPGLELVGEATDAREALKLAQEHTAELVLVDSELPGAFIGELIADLHALVWRPTVIVMGIHSGHSGMLLKAGADAFVSKGEQPELLIMTLRRYATH